MYINIPIELKRFFVGLCKEERDKLWIFFDGDPEALNLCCDALVNKHLLLVDIQDIDNQKVYNE